MRRDRSTSNSGINAGKQLYTIGVESNVPGCESACGSREKIETWRVTQSMSAVGRKEMCSVNLGVDGEYTRKTHQNHIDDTPAGPQKSH
jgi:hypothetical protein